MDAERATLAWLAGLAGLPGDTAGGCFVPGSTLGTLSALHVARAAWRDRRSFCSHPEPKPTLVASADAHSSIAQAARVLDVELYTVDPVDWTANAIDRLWCAKGTDSVFALVATAGTTNAGLIDDLGGLGIVCRRHGVWFRAVSKQNPDLAVAERS